MIGIVHNVPSSQSEPFAESSSDVMTQVESIEYVMRKLGYVTKRLPFTRDLAAFVNNLREEPVDMVFNLCETVDENPLLGGHPAAVLELLDMPFSGSPSMAIMLSTDKVTTKRLLKGRGIKTPDYLIYEGSEHFNPACLTFPVIVKPRYEDASIGIDQESIFESEKELKAGLKNFYERFGTLIVEEYIDGREFNVSLFGYPLPQVMPVAEIDFSGLTKDLYSIVGYRAKWDKSSFEYHHTSRKFSTLPRLLLSNIEKVASLCFTSFMLRDYGRVDIRVDKHGKIYVLEVNANPCLSPDAGFPAALHRGGIPYTNMVKSLIRFMTQRSPHEDHSPRFSRQR